MHANDLWLLLLTKLTLLVFNGRLANCRLTSLVNKATSDSQGIIEHHIDLVYHL